MELKTDEWKPFFLKDLYDIEMGNKFDKNKMSLENPEVNFVTRISYNNGIDEKVDRLDEVSPYPAGLLTVSLGGSLGECFIQEEPFYTAQNVAVLKPVAPEMTHAVNMFISVLVKAESKVKYYAFGRELNSHIKKDFTVSLPVLYSDNGTAIIDKNRTFSKEGFVPDWKFMEGYINKLNTCPVKTVNKTKPSPLDIAKWDYFELGKLFRIQKGKRLTAEDQIDGDNNYIGAIDSNNGVANHIAQSPLHPGNTITINYNGSVGEAFFQQQPFWATDDVNVLYPNAFTLTADVGLFLVTVLRYEKYRFSYGRKWTKENMIRYKIKLPVKYNLDGSRYIDADKSYSERGFVPDWEYMSKYIKSLPFGDQI